MKPLIFEPENRPTLYTPEENGVEKNPYSVSECGNDFVILPGLKQLPLRGNLYFKNQKFSFKKVNEFERDNLFQAKIKLPVQDTKDLYRQFLVNLPPQQLSEWMLDNLAQDQEYIENYPKVNKTKQLSLITKVFEFIITSLYVRPWLSILLLIAILIFPISQLPNIKVDPSLDRILVPNSPEMKFYNESLSLFGTDKSVILYIKDKNLFTDEKLLPLRKLAWDLEKWPDIEKVNSVFTSSFIRNRDDALYTQPLFEEIPFEQSLLKEVQDDPILHGRLIDIPKKTIIFVIKVEKNQKGLHEISDKIADVLKPIINNYEVFFQTGEPSIQKFQTIEMKESTMIFIPLIAFILLLGFYFFIGSLHAFFITLFSTIVSIICSFGIMTAFDIPIQIMIVLVPGITLTLSATEIVHMATSLKSAWSKGLNGVHALRYMSRDIGKAIFLTFTSTSLGFLSIRISEILILKEFAVVSFMSLSLVFVITLIYLPLHFSFFEKFIENKNIKKEAPQKGENFFTSLLEGLKERFYLFYLSTFFNKKFIIFMIIFIVVHLIFTSKVRMDNDSFEMISNRSIVKKNLNYFKEKIGGMREIHLVLESKNIVTRPDHLKKIWELHQKLENLDEVNKVQSIAGILSLLNREMRSGNQVDYKLPMSQNLIDQYMLSLSRDDFSPFLSPDKFRSNIRIYHDVSSSVKTEAFIKNIKDLAKKVLKGSNLEFRLTSRNILNVQAGNTIIKSQTLSLISMGLVIIFLMSLFFRSIKVALISLIPNLLPIIGLFGIMGIFNIPLNIGTCIVAAITIGIAADDTIHLFSRYLDDRVENLNPLLTGKESIREELTPILTTSLSLALSFVTFVFSHFIPMVQFGLLSAYVMVLAVISDLYLGPYILTFFDFKNLKTDGHKFSYLLDSNNWNHKTDLGKLRISEVLQLLRMGKFEIVKKNNDLNEYIPNQNDLTFLLKGEFKNLEAGNIVNKPDVFDKNSNITLRVSKERLKYISPRIFEKICHNLKD